MRKYLLFTLLTIVCSNALYAQKNADNIIGKWLTGSGNAHVEIYKNGNQYQGKIVWLSEPIDPETKKPKTDTKHPNADQHNRPLLGLINLWGFHYNDKEGHWEGGHIYDPKNGKEYKCTISSNDKNTLNVRGYIGISLIGRTDIWTKVKN